MRLLDNPIYRLEMRRWRSALPPGSIERRLAVAGIAVLLGATVFAHAFPWLYHMASLKAQVYVGYLDYPLYFIPGITRAWNPLGGGLNRLVDLATNPIADLFFPSNLVASLAPPLLVGRYVSRLRGQRIADQLLLTRLHPSEIAQGAVWGRLIPVLVLVILLYGCFSATPFSPIGPLTRHPKGQDHSGDTLFAVSIAATKTALCVQAVACAYIALAVSARLAKTRFTLPVSLVLCVVCIPTAAYSFGCGVGYRVWAWLGQHGWWTAPFMGAVWRCELLKIALIFVFYLGLSWLAKGAATVEIERLMGTRRTRWRL
jgi:hypothetical protein